MFKTIMIALDGSIAAERALPAAADIARRSGGTMHLVHVLDVLSRPDYTRHMSSNEYWNGGALDAARRYLRVTVERMQAGHTFSVTHNLLDGQIVAELLAETERVAPDLIVMTTHGVGGFQPGWIGSVADRMVRQSTAPVLLLRANFTQMVPFSHVLVALDGSELAEQILPPAAKLARINGARLTLLTVARPRLMPVPVFAGIEAPLVVDRADLSFQAEPSDAKALDHAASVIAPMEIDVETEVVVTLSPPASAVLEFGEMSGADCIAMATRGRGRIARWLLGSVTDKVVRNAHCAVLLYSPPDSDQDQTIRRS